MALPVSQYLRPGARITALILIGSVLMGMVVNSWHAALAPRDWMNYLEAACLFLLLLAWWLIRRWIGSGEA